MENFLEIAAGSNLSLDLDARHFLALTKGMGKMVWGGDAEITPEYLHEQLFANSTIEKEGKCILPLTLLLLFSNWLFPTENSRK